MRIDLKTNSLALLQKSKRADKKLAYATVNAINNAAKIIQQEERDHVKRVFHTRGDFVLKQAAVIKPFASVGKSIPYAEISVGRKDRFLLGEFEEGGERKPFTPGAKRVAIPFIDDKPRAETSDKFSRDLFFKALRLRPIKQKRLHGPPKPGHLTVWKGAHRTYMIPSIGVFQRYGSGKGQTRLLYLFDKDVPIDKRLDFLEIAEKDGATILTEEMEKAIIKEIQRGL